MDYSNPSYNYLSPYTIPRSINVNPPQDISSYMNNFYQNTFNQEKLSISNYSGGNLFQDHTNQSPYASSSIYSSQPSYFDSPEYNNQYCGVDLRSNASINSRDDNIDMNNNTNLSGINLLGYHSLMTDNQQQLQILSKHESPINNSSQSLLSDILDSSEQPVEFDLSKGDKSQIIKENATHDVNGVKIPKKRGPKKKPLTKEREMKLKFRRMRANTRERNRMHSLNDALEELRTKVPTFSTSQRLSKIETLRLARNYIIALDHLLKVNGLSLIQMAMVLTNGLTQNTTNLICTQLKINTADLLNLRERVKVQPMSGDSTELSTYFSDEQISEAFSIIATDYPGENKRNADYSELLKCLGLLGQRQNFDTPINSSQSDTYASDYSFQGLIHS